MQFVNQLCFILISVQCLLCLFQYPFWIKWGPDCVWRGCKTRNASHRITLTSSTRTRHYISGIIVYCIGPFVKCSVRIVVQLLAGVCVRDIQQLHPKQTSWTVSHSWLFVDWLDSAGIELRGPATTLTSWIMFIPFWEHVGNVPQTMFRPFWVCSHSLA